MQGIILILYSFLVVLFAAGFVILGPKFRAQHLSLEVTSAIAAVFLLYVLMAGFFSRTSLLFGFWRSPRGRTWIRAVLAALVGAFLVYGGSGIIIHSDYYLPYSDHPGGLFSNVLTDAWNSFGKIFGPAAPGGLTAIIGLAACYAAIQYARRGCAEPGRLSDPTPQETEQSANDSELEFDATGTGNIRALEGSIAVVRSYSGQFFNNVKFKIGRPPELVTMDYPMSVRPFVEGEFLAVAVKRRLSWDQRPVALAYRRLSYREDPRGVGYLPLVLGLLACLGGLILACAMLSRRQSGIAVTVVMLVSAALGAASVLGLRAITEAVRVLSIHKPI
jgi:hypothetical protein